VRAETDELAYSFCRYSEEQKDDDHGIKLQAFGLLGQVFGKAVFEKIPLNCFLDRTIIKQLLGIPVVLEDICFFDK
jgi:hypothetical protein